MANKAMKDRHWERIATLTGHTFDVQSDNFQLRNIMEAPLLQNKDDIEDICISAVKEKDIEAKLKQVIAEWSVQNLGFSTFKTRGELLLKGAETSEIVSLMEDSLMVLGSLMSNRSVPPSAHFSDLVHVNECVIINVCFVGTMLHSRKRFSSGCRNFLTLQTSLKTG